MTSNSLNLQSVAQKAASGPFTEAQIRWWIFNAGSNGMEQSGALVRIGRRIYIDIEGFDRWLDLQNTAKGK